MKALGRIAAVIVTIELCLQIFSYSQFIRATAAQQSSKSFHNWYTKKPETSWWQNELSALVPAYHPFLGYIFTDITTSHIHINKSGVRDTAYNPPQENSTYKKVFFFGGSSMMGYGVKDDETIPSYIAKQLNAPKPRFVFYNYGQIRYNFNQELLFFLLQLKQGNIPDLVIFYNGFNDAVLTVKTSQENHLNGIVGEPEYRKKMGSLATLFLPAVKNTSIIDAPMIENIGNFFLTRIKLIRYPLEIFQRLTRNSGQIKQQVKPEATDELIQKTAENYAMNAKLLEALSREYHFKYLLLWQPLPQFKTLTQEEVNDTEISYYPDDVVIIQKTISAIKERNLESFHDLSYIFENQADTSLFMDAIHVTPRGNEIISNRISGLLENALNQQ